MIIKIQYIQKQRRYRNVVHIKVPFFISISCNFELLEQKLKEYIGDIAEETKFIKDVEITCEVYEEISTIIKALEDKSFQYIEEFTLDDIYMQNEKTKEFATENGKITDTLIIRQ